MQWSNLNGYHSGHDTDVQYIAGSNPGLWSCFQVVHVNYEFVPKEGYGILHASVFVMWAGMYQSVLRLITGWTVSESNPGGGEILRTRPERPWGPPSLLYNGYRVSFPG
jgi:hypothetical protein